MHGDPLALWNVDTQRETLRYLREQGATLTGSALSTLADAILRGPNAADGREPEQRNWHSIRLRLWKLQTSGAELPRTAKERLHQIDEKMPWHSTDDFSEEFPVYVSAGWSGDLIGRQNVRFQAMSDTDFIAWLNSKQDDVLPGENGWEDFCRDHPVQALSLLKAASAQELWPEDQWRYLFWALQETHETEATTALLDVLDKMPDETLQKIGLETARWLEKQRQHLDTESWLSAWDRVWQTNVGGDGEREGPPTLDLTLNEAGGVLGSAMLDQLGAQIPSVNADEKPGIPGNLAVYFQEFEQDGRAPKLARISLARNLLYLFRVDQDWTQRVLLDRMDVESQPTYEAGLWEGYLWSVRYSDDFLVPFVPIMKKVLRNPNLIPKNVRKNLFRLFAHLAITQEMHFKRRECAEILQGADGGYLVAVLQAMKHLVVGAGDRVGDLWEEKLKPWLIEVWPQANDAKSQEVTEAFIDFACETGAAFPEVVDSIEAYLAPLLRSGGLYDLRDHETLIERHPRAALKLISAVVDGNPQDFGIVVAAIIEKIRPADPSLDTTNLAHPGTGSR